MALQKPVVLYTAANNVEAQLLSVLLTENGVEAFAAEDVSAGGYWMGGNIAGIHKPRVWVDEMDLDRAQSLLERYQLGVAERMRAESAVGNSDGTSGMDVACEECGKTSQFPVTLLGSIQDCPHCGAYVDVGEVDETGEWDDDEEEAEEDSD